MRRSVFLYCTLLMVSACGDPLAGFTRISDVELVIDDAAQQALPTQQEISREGFFNTSAAEGITPPVEPTEPAVTAAEPRRGGLMGMLRRVVPVSQKPVTAERFDALKASENQPTLPVADDASTPGEGISLASLSPDSTPLPNVRSEPAAIVDQAPKRRGLLSRLTGGGGNKTSGPKATEGVEAPDINFGEEVPYGAIARVCSARGRPLGRNVETAGASGYKLWDSNPSAGAKGPRTFYLTGFDDKCPRQLTAAHVLFGEPAFYEQLHYGPTGKHLKLGATDAAYEKVKAKVCGVRRGKPCGAKIRKLEKGTVFISSYARLDDNTRWSELLVHEDVVVASSLKNQK